MIPKIIHHVWPGNDPFREKFHEWRYTWMKFHPDWSFYFWRLDNLPSNIHPDTKEALEDQKYAITPKSDMLRFEILRLFGGIYVDTDMECLKPFDEFRNNQLFSGFEDNVNICPSVIGCIPHHPLMSRMARISVDNAKIAGYKRSNRSPQTITSVAPFTKMLTEHADDEGIKIYPVHYFFKIGYKYTHRLHEETPESYAKHHWTGQDSVGWTNTIRFE